jgi:hypothetical protein
MAKSKRKVKRMEWYGAKAIFMHSDLAKNRDSIVYEERVVLLRAQNLDHAVATAERTAAQYVKGLTGCKYIGFVDVFRMYEGRIGHGKEIYSLMRESRLKPAKYLDRFYDSGSERSQGA